MKGSMRRSDRPESTRRRPEHELEFLERRELLASDPFRYYHSVLQPPAVGPGRGTPNNYLAYPVATVGPHVLGSLDNEGKVVSGKDRQGNEYIIKVHGPGAVIVTDATPNDGVLDDDLDTIQLVGTSPYRTQVVGQVIASARVQTDGTLKFQKLISQNGVQSIKLNGFTLTQTVTPPVGTPNYSNTKIYLPGGVHLLQFHNIEGNFDLAAGDVPILIQIGDPSTPLTYSPVIRLDSIFNTVVDSTRTVQPPGVPQTRPSVSIEVNGELKGLDIISSTARPFIAGLQTNYPTVSVTGRTAVRATQVGHVTVAGSARNVTFSRGPIPVRNAFVGLNKLKSAKFGGNADALAILSSGPIGKLQFNRGLGNPTGVSQAGTQLGTPTGDYGYPAYGLLGGVINASQIGSLKAGPADVIQQTTMDPDLIQLQQTNATNYYARPGAALTSAAVVSSGSIGEVWVHGNTVASEVKSGFHYASYVVGLEGTRAPSQIRKLTQRGDLIDGVNSASYRPKDGIYGNGKDVAGRGSITGHQAGVLYQNGHKTALNNLGTGNYARTKVGKLPPPQGPTRLQGVLRRV